ncbi:MAG TPA: two-component regulator propeller domain-containing protein, partial [bacterium]
GLNVYDRVLDRFSHLRSDPDDPRSLISDNINAVALDGDGRLWVGTRDGLCRYDGDGRKFVCYQHRENDPKSLKDNVINNVYVDSRNRIWILCQQGWLDRYNSHSDGFDHFQLFPPSPWSDLRSFGMLEDGRGRLWIGTVQNGLYWFDEKRQLPVAYPFVPPGGITSIRALLEDGWGNLWIGCREGLVILNTGTKALVRYAHSDNDNQSLIHSSVQSLFRDTKGDVWIGTRGGIDYVDNDRLPIRHVPALPGNPRFLNNGVVFALFEDSLGDLWVGTEWGGINVLKRGSERFVTFMHEPGNPNSLNSNNVKCVFEDRFGDVWIGTYEGGLNRYRRKENRFTHYLLNPGDPTTMVSNGVYWIMEDRKSDLWICTPNGISVYNRARGAFIRFVSVPSDSNTLSHSDCKFSYEDRSGTIWIGTFNGLNRFNRNSGTFTRFLRDKRRPNTLSDNFVQSLYEDSRGRFWVGTMGGGLNLFDRRTGTSEAFTEKDGLPNNSVFGILEDGHGNLWLSTNKGLSRFNPETRTFRNFDARDGLQGDQFNYNAFLKRRSGMMVFGGMNGFNAFHPDSLKENTAIPPVVLTGLQVNSKPVKIGKADSPLKKAIGESEEIRLSYKQNVIAFEFAALNYAGTPKNQYAYKMDGFEKDWNFVGTKRTATYMNLHPGSYTFRVRASNNHGHWNETGVSIRVVIRPPFWKTLWFQAALVSVLVFLLAGLVRARIQAVMKRNWQLEAVNIRLTRHIRRRKSAEKRIQVQLQEKVLLMREIHHRVKNNLQVISSLLRLEMKSITDPTYQRIFQKFQDRIKSIALVHEKLVQSTNFASIDFDGYI